MNVKNNTIIISITAAQTGIVPGNIKHFLIRKSSHTRNLHNRIINSKKTSKYNKIMYNSRKKRRTEN